MRKTNVRRVTHARRVMQAAPYPPKIPCPRPVISPSSDRHADRDEGEERRTPNTVVPRVDGKRPCLRDGAGHPQFRALPAPAPPQPVILVRRVDAAMSGTE